MSSDNTPIDLTQASEDCLTTRTLPRAPNDPFNTLPGPLNALLANIPRETNDSLTPLPRAPKRARDSFVKSDLIKVLVGPPQNREEFHIHKGIITSRSRFFANALSGRWSNSQTNTIDLYQFDPILKPDILARYLEVVYTSSAKIDDDQSPTLYVFQVYVLAEQMQDVRSRNVVFKALYGMMMVPMARFPSYDSIRIIYAGTASSENPVRRLLVERSRRRAFKASWTKQRELIEGLPKEFFVELTLALLQRGTFPADQKKMPFHVNLEEYLEKEEEEEEDVTVD